MNKLRDCDRNTKHLKGRIVFDGNDPIFPSAEEMFLRALEEKILASVKGLKSNGIELEFFNIEIK